MDQNFIFAHFGKTPTKILIDTGANISCVSKSFLFSIAPGITLDSTPLTQAQGVGGETHSILGTVYLKFQIEGTVFEHKFHVFSKLYHHIIIGDDFLVAHSVQIDRGTKSITFPERALSVQCCAPSSTSGLIRPSIKCCLPPGSEMLIPVKISRCPGMHTMLLLPKFIHSKFALLGARSVNTVLNGKTTCRLLNPNTFPVTVYPSQSLGVAYTVSSDFVCEITESPAFQRI